jgi:hypothetical protein
MKFACLLAFLTLFLPGQAQNNCSFLTDTVYIPAEKKTVDGEYVQTNLKNKSIVQLYKVPNGKFYMKMIVTENLYFNKVDMLEVRSGNKSFYAKDTKQFEYGNHTGYYIIEIFKNYIATLKEEGITSIVFSNSETKFTKQDRTQIMQIAKCFYESVAGKK